MNSAQEKILVAAEEAGLKIVVDSTKWFEEAKDLAKAERDYPLDPRISPSRVDLVKEARRLADMLDSRPKQAPDGVVYRHSEQALKEALARAVKHIGKSTGKIEEKEDAGHIGRHPGQGGEQDSGGQGNPSGGIGSQEDRGGASLSRAAGQGGQVNLA